MDQLAEDEGEVAAVIRERFTFACHAESLTGCAADQHVELATPRRAIDAGHVAKVRNVRVVVGQNARGELLNL